MLQLKIPRGATKRPHILQLRILHAATKISSVQSLSRVWLFATPWIAAHQPSLSVTMFRSLPKPMSIELVMPSSHLILCRPLLLLPPILPSIWVFSNESALHMRWPKYWSFSLNISPSNEHPGPRSCTEKKKKKKPCCHTLESIPVSTFIGSSWSLEAPFSWYFCYPARSEIGIFCVQMSAKPARSCPRRKQLALTVGLTAESRERSGSIHNSPDVPPKISLPLQADGLAALVGCCISHRATRILTKHCFLTQLRDCCLHEGRPYLNMRSKLWDCLTIDQLSVSWSFVVAGLSGSAFWKGFEWQ